LIPVVELGRFHLFRFAVAAVAIGTIHVALAAALESPRFTRLSVEDGLSQSSVQHILQDRSGRLWFGSQEGLNRYDGYRFTVHRARDQQGFLHDHEISSLIEDAGGDLWVGTARGLYRHDLQTGRFDGVAAPANGLHILQLVQGGDGRLFFFAASDARLWVFDPAAADRPARALTDGAFSAVTQVTALARGQGSTIWAAAQGRLFKVDLTSAERDARLTEVLRDLGSVSVLATDSGGDVWIGRSDGAELLRYRPADGRVDPFPQVPRNTLAILPGKKGEIWIGARKGGLTRLDPKSGQLVTFRHDPEDAASLSTDDVAEIYEDANGSLWIGTWNGGVNRFDPRAQGFRSFKYRERIPESLPANDVTAMTEMADGSLWLISRGGIVAAGDPASGRFRSATTLPVRGRFAALESLAGRLLVGTSRGLVMLDTPSGREVPLDAALGAHGLDRRPIAAIRGAPGVAWFASGKELFRVAGDGASGAVSLMRFDVPIAGSVTALSSIFPATGSGRLWIGSDRGEVVRAEWNAAGAAVELRSLDRVEPAARESFAARGLVAALHEDPHGRLWVGTRRGLGRVELISGKVSWLGQPDGIPSTNISGIVTGGDGQLWIAHNRGLTRMEPASGAITQFGERDGAQGTGYAEGAWAAGRSGLIYFAGQGVTAFDPRDVGISPYHPRIVFTALEILHRAVAPRWLDPGSPLERAIDAQSEVTLDPDATVFAVEMAPLHYADPPSNRLMYRLEGFDPDWIETEAFNRVATYTNLAPGTYVLHARAGTKNGLWSEREATLVIHLLPPWWRTRGALALWSAMALVAAALVLTSARRRARVKLALLERDTLRRESLTDPLTGLHNRRFLMSWLEKEMPKVVREYRAKGAAGAAPGADLLLLLVDVDHFKSINDRHSHAVGDRVLTRIAGVLTEHVRGSDLAVRWGGDEFLVVTRSFERTRAAESAERLRAAVEALGSKPAAAGDPPATVSIGFAPFPFLPHQPDALTWEQTLELADHALHVTKQRRRNSYTGLRATAGLTAASVLEFLGRGCDGPLPAAVELQVPDDGSGIA
jgi:diguanylate cyclase (GGDEF)-like protein